MGKAVYPKPARPKAPSKARPDTRKPQPHMALVPFNPELAATILTQIAEGRSITDICRADAGMPSRVSVHNWIARNHEGFGDAYVRAHTARADVFADEILDIADDASGDYVDRDGERVPDRELVQRARLRVDVRKWLMARIAPTKYGDRVTVAGDGSAPVIINQINLVPVEPTRLIEGKLIAYASHDTDDTADDA